MPPPPLPLKGETPQHYAARKIVEDARRVMADRETRKGQQVGWFDRAGEVFIAEVVERNNERVEGLNMPSVILKPVRWLKGSGSAHPLHVAYSGWTTCGPYGGGEAPTGRVGSLFVVYDVPGETDGRGKINVALASVLDPRLINLIARAN